MLSCESYQIKPSVSLNGNSNRTEQSYFRSLASSQISKLGHLAKKTHQFLFNNKNTISGLLFVFSTLCYLEVINFSREVCILEAAEGAEQKMSCSDEFRFPFLSTCVAKFPIEIIRTYNFKTLREITSFFKEKNCQIIIDPQ